MENQDVYLSEPEEETTSEKIKLENRSSKDNNENLEENHSQSKKAKLKDENAFLTEFSEEEEVTETKEKSQILYKTEPSENNQDPSSSQKIVSFPNNELLHNKDEIFLSKNDFFLNKAEFSSLKPHPPKFECDFFNPSSPNTPKLQSEAHQDENWHQISDQEYKDIASSYRPSEYHREPKYNFGRKETPLKIFSRVFPNDLFECVLIHTNGYGKKIFETEKMKKRFKIKKFEDIKLEELKHFIAIHLLMGIVKLPEWRDYWEPCSDLMDTQIRRVMNMDRFEIISKCFNIYEDEGSNGGYQDTIGRLTFFKKITSKLNEPVTSHEFLLVSEKEYRFGRQKIDSNGNKEEGLKVKCIFLRDITGYTLNIKVLVENSNRTRENDAIIFLLDDFQKLNHKLMIENIACDYLLFEKLSAMNIESIGPAKINDRFFPKIINNTSTENNNENVYFVNDNDLFAVKNSRNSVLLSNCKTFQFNFAEKLKKKDEFCILNYQAIENIFVKHQSLFKPKKWWKLLFFDLLETSLLNSFIIFNTHLSHPINYKQFKLFIIESLISKPLLETLSEKHEKSIVSVSQTSPETPNENEKAEKPEPDLFRVELNHLPEKMATKYYKFCLVCSHNRIKRKSSMGCLDCSQRFARDVSLCVTDCFTLFHQNPKKYLARNRRREKKDKKELEKKQQKKIKQIKKIRKVQNKQKNLKILRELGVAGRTRRGKMRRFAKPV